MSSTRKALRADLIEALAEVVTGTALAAAPVISAWSQSLDPATLPVIGVTVPTEERSPAAMDADEVQITAIIVIKRIAPGDDSTDLEDALDDDAEALIGPLEAAMQGASRDFALRSSAIEISGAGSPRIGTLTLTFSASVWRGRTLPL